jgi:putative ATPase
MSDDFFKNGKVSRPLASRLRPVCFDEFVGQTHLMSPDGSLRRLVISGNIPSMIFWGPPGTGKTTAAQIICQSLFGEIEKMSATSASVKEIREAAVRAQKRQEISDKKTYLFVDEIHRFNRSQQDALLPYVEDGTLTLLAATTENPSFYVNHALLSRCRVFVFEPLNASDLQHLLEFALSDEERGLGKSVISLSDEAREVLIRAASGDARHLLVTLQIAADLLKPGESHIDVPHLEQALGRQMFAYDKKGEFHYDVVSAFIKSLRGSDPHAAVHYLARMLESGEDPRFIARRMVIFASEDVGNADPQAIQVAVAAMQSYEWTGMPEGYLPLTQAATYLASAPKSNAVITAYGKAKEALAQAGAVPVPVHLRNAVTQLAAELGHGAAYQYPHNYEGNFVQQHYLPEKLRGHKYYNPTQNGYERFIRDRLIKLGMLNEPEAGKAKNGERENQDQS